MCELTLVGDSQSDLLSFVESAANLRLMEKYDIAVADRPESGEQIISAGNTLVVLAGNKQLIITVSINQSNNASIFAIQIGYNGDITTILTRRNFSLSLLAKEAVYAFNIWSADIIATECVDIKTIESLRAELVKRCTPTITLAQ